MPTVKRIKKRKTNKQGKKQGRCKTTVSSPRVQTTLPWSQQPTEGIMAYMAFCAFRDMGPARSLRKLATRGFDLPRGDDDDVEHHMLAYRSLTGYSEQFDWVHRANAWDRHQDKIRQREMTEDSRKAARRSFKIAQLCQTISWNALRRIAKRLDTDAELIEKFDPKDLMDMFARVAKLQKDLQAINLLTFGEPTEITATAPSAPGGLFSTSQDFMALVRSDSAATELFSKLTARLAILRADAPKEETT